MSTDEKVQALADAVSYLLSVVMATAPSNYRDHASYLQETMSEILEEA